MGLKSAISQKNEAHSLLSNWEERRVHPRHTIGAMMQYRTADMTAFEDGVLHDLSRSGALISLRRAVHINTEIHMVVAGDKTEDLPIHIIAAVVRKPSDAVTHEGYPCACKIIQISDLN